MKVIIQNKYLIDFFATVMFFTRIPINWAYFSNKAPDLTRAAWSFPIVGFLIGIISGICGEFCILVNLPIFLSCTIAVAVSLMITGAFHEDGLADMADGFGAGGSPEKINEIMHDSRLGTYGTSALTLGLLIRIGITIALVDLGYSMLIILAISFASGKLAILFMRNFSYTSNFAKTGTIIEYISFKKILLATIIWSIAVVFIFPFFSILLGIFLASVVVLTMIKLSNQKLGGITGDILGATAFLTELAFMLGLVIYLGSIF